MKYFILIIWGILIIYGSYTIVKSTPNNRDKKCVREEETCYCQANLALKEDIEPEEEVEDFFRYHFVRRGETLAQIAKHYNIKATTIIALNNLKNQVLFEGQVLVIPKTDGIMYKVKHGENLWVISKMFRVPISKIKKANSLEANLIKKGDRLFLPGANLAYYNYKKRKNNYKRYRYVNSRVSFAEPAVGIDFLKPAVGRITSKFGPRWGRFHTGIDIGCGSYSPIYAACSGKVIKAGWFRGYGKTVIIKHKNGYSTLYAHLAKITTSKGTWVNQGEIIGYSGSTGKAVGCHLHFEIRMDNRPINPLPYITSRGIEYAKRR
jgi:murein DD-endopeptidase MepM/ murein hydrolase activator NlpD